MKCSIYRFTNKQNGKVYIGQTSYTLNERMSAHLSAAKSGSRYKFHQALRKYGLDGFEVDVICMTTTVKDACDMEKHFIREHNSYRNGYNSTEGGQGSPCSLEKARKISEAKKGKPQPWSIGNKTRAGYKWFNNGTDNISVAPGEQPPEGYQLGRINKPGPRLNGTKRPKLGKYNPSTKPRKQRSPEDVAKTTKNLLSGKGTIWITNGIDNLRHTKDSSIPEGYQRGRAKNADH